MPVYARLRSRSDEARSIASTIALPSQPLKLWAVVALTRSRPL
jgi:hypothetical protein